MLRETFTENGRVRGTVGTDARITVYKGIPFADDTSGKNRWRPPQPAKDWEGVRDCSEFGPIPFQRVPGRDPEAFYSKEWHVDPEVPMSEDCLRANIWTPAKKTDEKLPVMIWIFGGGLMEGYPHEMEFDGERIASRGVILVSIGYRLNAFSQFAHPLLTKEQPEAPGNFAFLDQAYGIAWVKRNIANFGGDPENITIFGQSAGAMSVLVQMCSPKTRGLFQRGIIQSIGGMSPRVPNPMGVLWQSLKEMEDIGVRLFEKLGVTTMEEARAVDARTLCDAWFSLNLFLGPTVDGVFLPKSVDDTIRDGEMQDLPFIIGCTKDEFLIHPQGETDEEVLGWIRGLFGDKADDYIASLDPALPLKEAASIHYVRLGNELLNVTCAKQGRKFYHYYFCPTIPGDDAGCFHSSDLWFSFETLMKCWRPFDGHHFDLARKMCNYWTNFAKNGDPNGNDKDGTPMPEWRPYTTADQHPMLLGDEVRMAEGPKTRQEQYLLDENVKAYEET